MGPARSGRPAGELLSVAPAVERGPRPPTRWAANVTGVARSASDTTAAASSTSQAADELARLASDLRQLVGQFTY